MLIHKTVLAEKDFSNNIAGAISRLVGLICRISLCLTGDRIGEGAGPYLTVPVVSAALLAGQEILSFPHRPL